MRGNPTDAERKLWLTLRNKRLAGYKFKRQVVIDWYIADFVNFDQRVIVEADGSQHLESDYDVRRDAYLKAEGFTVLRYWNNDILLERQSIEEAIWAALQNFPLPLREREIRAERARERGRELRGCGVRSPPRSLRVALRALSRRFAPPSPARGEG